MRVRIVVLFAALVAGFLNVSNSAAVTGSTPAWCPQPERAVSFNARGRVKPYHGVACTTGTGFLTAETHLRVAPNGTIVQQPAVVTSGIAGTGFVPGAPGPKPENQLSPAGFAISRDGGQTFERVLPADTEWVMTDGAIHIDAKTGRLYYYALSPATIPGSGTDLASQLPAGYAQMVTSGDDGRTWFATTLPGYIESENPRFASGVAPARKAQPVRGESVAYWCGNTFLFGYGQRDCWRTLDGGHTWELRGTYLRRGVPVHSVCGMNEEVFNSDDGYYPEISANGVLWTALECGGHTYLARSRNEAKSFAVVREIPPTDELRLDSTGRLYSVKQVGEALLLRTSTDHGQTWTKPVDLVAPSLRGATLSKWWNVALGAPGQFAVAYLSEHQGGGYDASVTVQRGSRFVAATVNGGLQPVITNPTSAKDDYIDVDIAPDGTAWGTFFGDCTTVAACDSSDYQFEAVQSVLLHVG